MQHHGSCPDQHPTPDANALDHRGTDTYVAALPDGHATGDPGARRDMGVVPDPRVVVDERSGVDDHVDAQGGAGIQDHTGEDNGRVPERDRRRDHRPWMDDRREAEARGD